MRPYALKVNSKTDGSIINNSARHSWMFFVLCEKMLRLIENDLGVLFFI